MDFNFGHWCSLFGIFFSVLSVSGSHQYRSYSYRHYHYYYYYYENDGNASMVAGSIIGGLIAICIIIGVIVVLVHSCNCCKTQGVRGHVVRPTTVSTVTTNYYGAQQPNDWVYLPASAPPYQSMPSKPPPQYSSVDSNPPPAYEDISAPSQAPDTSRITSPAPPYSPRSEQKL